MSQETEARESPAGITVRRDGDVAWIKLDDGRGNVLGTASLTALSSAIIEASDADAVVLVGRPKIFCGGLDLGEIASMEATPLLEFLDLLHSTRRALFALARPLVTAAAGSAVGAGAALLCCGDQRLGARDGGLVGFTEARLGVPLPASALVIAETAIHLSFAARALLFGELFGREEALAVGFFHRLIPPEQLCDEAASTARAAAALSRASGMIKRAMRREALRRMDSERGRSHEIFAAEWTSPAAQVRIQAVLQGLRAR